MNCESCQKHYGPWVTIAAVSEEVRDVRAHTTSGFAHRSLSMLPEAGIA